MQDDIKPVLTDEEILAVGAFGPSPLKRLEHGRAIEQAVLRVLAPREGRQQPIYGYHIVSEANGNGVAFCPADHAEEITAFLMAYPGTTIVPVVRAPSDAQRAKGDGNA